MARLNDLGQGKIESPKIRPEIIVIRRGNNFRDTTTPEARKHIAWLKESIRETGVQKPVSVEYIGGEVYLVAGECRTIAAQQLREEGLDLWIPATPVKGDEPTLLANSIIDNGGLMPTILEFGEAFRRLAAHGWKEQRIALYVPTSVADTASKRLKFVKDALELNAASLEVKRIVSDGVDGVSVSPALAVAATKKNKLQAAEILKKEAGDAKAAGKTTVKRHKGEGKVGKAKKVEAAKAMDLMSIGDSMAGAILGESGSVSTAERMARAWQKARG